MKQIEHKSRLARVCARRSAHLGSSVLVGAALLGALASVARADEPLRDPYVAPPRSIPMPAPGPVLDPYRSDDPLNGSPPSSYGSPPQPLSPYGYAQPPYYPPQPLNPYPSPPGCAQQCPPQPLPPYPQQPLPPYPPACRPPACAAPYYQPYAYPPPRPIKKKGKGYFKLSFGYDYRYAGNTDLHGAALELGFGGEGEHGGGGGRFGVTVGQTSDGRRFEALGAGPAFELKLGRRVRLGFGATVGLLVLDNGYDSDDWLFTLGTHLESSIDLVQSLSGGALYLGARAGIDLLVPTYADGIASFVARGFLGYRF